jgi:hypothetical protein
VYAATSAGAAATWSSTTSRWASSSPTELNPAYGDVWPTTASSPTRPGVRGPNRKGTVENAIQHTQSIALKGHRFETIEEQNTFLEQWETRWAAPRIHGSARRQVEAMCQEERAHLKPLPLAGFRYFTECERQQECELNRFPVFGSDAV